MAIEKATTFSKNLSLSRGWAIDSSLLYRLNISLKITVDVFINTATGVLDHIDCEASNININVEDGPASGAGFYDVYVVTWKFKENNETIDAGPSYQPETWADVKSNLEDKVKDLANNGIVGYYFDNRNNTNRGRISYDNYKHTFTAQELRGDDPTIINAVARYRDNDRAHIMFRITTADISFDPSEYFYYYPMAIKKNDTHWMSCNRNGSDDRVGSLRQKKSNTWDPINSYSAKGTLFNNFRESATQRFFIMKNNSWKRSALIGEDKN